MHEQQLQRVFRQHLGLRIGPHSARYVASRIDSDVPVPVIGMDARTGVARHHLADAAELRQLLQTDPK